ncbi:hypothetical protein COMNV_00843 [Commensalibacter sp. Nvir]|uniref:hypothetical protein n=1 Tax=Commensalibacter sp. Nvir TaxID=3069817 RepID=UPI002D4EF229|nr:hypothetical protein COMNV_00843 [Commensalibacter sp. Nvir]
MLKWLCVGMICILSTTNTWAKRVEDDDACQIVFLQDVAAMEEPSNFMAKGSTLGGVTTLRVDKETHNSYVCQHGGNCYPYRISVWNNDTKMVTKNIPTVRFLNCVVGDISFQDDTSFDYVLREIYS